MRFTILALVLLLIPAAARAATLFDPNLRFQRICTEHFIVYFHQGAEPAARRLAGIAEEVWRRMRRPDLSPPDLTHVVLADQGELANGWATPVPYNTIVLSASSPAGSEFIGNVADWLRLVLTHELAHIVHLDRSRGWARGVRVVFGRVPLAFPNLFLPTWQTEGLATYEESRLTGSGRLLAGDFRAIEREAARTGRLEPLDRVNGGVTDWPGGHGPYAYGLGFHEFLAARFGEERFHALAQSTAGRLPYTGSTAFTPVFGQSLGRLWREYEDARRPQAGASAADAQDAADPSKRVNPASGAAARLTWHGFAVLGPRFAPPACAACPQEIVYSVRDPHGFPALRAIAPDGSNARELATRYLGSTAGVSRDSVVFDQHELRRNVGLYADLFVYDRRTGAVRALTTEARLLDPDLSPDGRRIVCVREGLGRRELVVLDLDAPGDVAVLVSEPDTQFNAPRWSPNGLLIAVERHLPGRKPDLALVDPATRQVRAVPGTSAARVVTPAWRPDGGAIIAAASVDNQPFDLYEFTVDEPSTVRRLTMSTGGASWPDVSRDGRTIVFAGYTPDGFDLFTMPYPPAGAADLDARGIAATAPPQAVTPSPAAGLVAPYSPWSTLRPVSWTPAIDTSDDQLRLGASIGGRDVLGYHAYGVSATWLVVSPETGADASRRAPDWQVSYAYDRWRPTLFASASRRTGFFAGPPTQTGEPSSGVVLEREIEVGAVYPVRRVRATYRGLASFLRSRDRYERQGPAFDFDRAAARVGLAASWARSYGYSISRENGAMIGATAELVRPGLGASADGAAYTVDARAYLPGLGTNHVVALRAGGGVSTGDADGGRTFLLGGAEPAGDVLDFDRDAFSLLRGFPANSFAGSRVAIANLDYRLPLARPQRGYGTWPILLHTVHAAAFADAGHAWTRDFRAGDVKIAVGGELSLDVVAGYYLRLTVAMGGAWTRDGARQETGAGWYVRIGRAF